MITATGSQMREIDRNAIEERGISSLELMENAACSVTTEVKKLLRTSAEPRVCVFCGCGNNGGDGLAVARQLMQTGVSVTVFLVGNPQKQTADSLANTEALEAVGGRLIQYVGQTVPDCDCIVDALFGVGLNRELTGEYRKAVEAINAANLPVVACDIPSGINGDSGRICGVAVKAFKTVTFSCAKPGLLCKPGSEFAGELLVKDIGIPADIILKLTEENEANKNE